MSYDFEESSGQRITYAPNADYTSQVSVAFWTKIESLPGAHQMHFVDKGKDDAGNNRNFSIYWTPASGGQIGVSWDQPSGAYHEFSYNINLASAPNIVGSWASWYAEIDWTQNPDSCVIWINGTQYTLSNTFGGNDSTPLTTATQQLSLGGEHGSSDNVNNFDGLMSDVGIWSDVVGSTRASGLYNSGSGGLVSTLYPTNLIEDIPLRDDPDNDGGGSGTLSSSPPTLSSDNPFAVGGTTRKYLLTTLGVG